MSAKFENDYSNHFIVSDELPSSHISNVNNPLEGYPKLQKLKQLKQKQIQKHSTIPFGYRCLPREISSLLENWIEKDNLRFDVIMIGGMCQQSVLPILEKLPLLKLCSKPGFLYIWVDQKDNQKLSLILLEIWGKKFRRSEELIFIPVSKNSKAYPHQYESNLFENQQWHCWMCITGTVRRSNDLHLIHCNIDTDLQFEKKNEPFNIVPESMYKVIENFSNFNRRLHIVPYLLKEPLVRMRPGWVIMSPNSLLHNFSPLKYESELFSKSSITYKSNRAQFLVSQTEDIEELRPKSPKKSQ